MSISIIDIVAFLLLLLIAVFSAKKGLFKAVTGFAAYVVSAFIARMAANPVSRFVYEKFLSEKITSHLSDVIPDGKTVMMSVTDILPEKAVRIAEFFKFLPDKDSVAVSINSALSIEKIETTYIMPIVLKILLVITTVVLFIIIGIILRFTANIINNAVFNKKKGALSKINRFLGFLLGLLKGALPVGIFCEALNLITPLVGNELLTSSVSNSYICSFIAGLIK